MERAWLPDAPESLLRLCLVAVVKRLDILSSALTNDVFLPAEICEALLETIQAEDVLYPVKLKALRLVHLLSSHPTAVHLKSLSLQQINVRTKDLEPLLHHGLKRLNLRNCYNTSKRLLSVLKENCGNLVSLTLYDSCQKDTTESSSQDRTELQQLVSSCPLLQQLSLGHLSLKRAFYLQLPTQLTHLELLDCSRLPINIQSLSLCKNLIALTLHNVHQAESAIPSICQLKQLRHLEISQISAAYEASFDYENFLNPEETLRSIVESMPDLQSLDISGTNLAVHRPPKSSFTVCDISGLESRVGRPLAFLGIYNMEDRRCDFSDIPAITVAGDQSEERILVAGQVYLKRKAAAEMVLKDLVEIVRNSSNIRKALIVVINIMREHIGILKIQTMGAACLYYILRQISINVDDSELQAEFNMPTKRLVIQVLLHGMYFHRHDRVLARNGILALWQLKIPEDLALLYEDVIDAVLFVLSYHHKPDDTSIQRSAIILLNSLVCQAEGDRKKRKGLDIVLTMLAVVQRKLETGEPDEILETAWSTMWNVTDETPANSEAFLANGGMNVFLRCKMEFPDSSDLLRNMMGLLGNVAEDRNCRKRLLNKEFVEEFYFLLDSNSDGVEVSYNAAGVLSHIASDGAEVWSLAEPTREAVLARMRRAIARWPINCDRNINYRSLKPIISLLYCWHTPECQLWASWALANLSHYHPEKYCQLVREEGGEEAVKLILASDCQDQMLQGLCNQVLTNLQRYDQPQPQNDQPP